MHKIWSGIPRRTLETIYVDIVEPASISAEEKSQCLHTGAKNSKKPPSLMILDDSIMIQNTYDNSDTDRLTYRSNWKAKRGSKKIIYSRGR